jgi:capsid protein
VIAGSSDPLFDDWDAWMRDPSQEWSAAWTLVASRAKSLAEDSPECAAMIRAKLLRIHGPNGLKFRSLYQSDDSAETSQAEVETRRQIERAIGLGSTFIDAGGVISRSEFDWQMSWNACVLGDAFAVRVWQDVDGVPTSTRWRIIHPARVCAPSDKAADPRYQGGIEVDINGRPVALWVNGPSVTASGLYQTPKPERIAWRAPDGTPNVVHKVGLRTPGSNRGLSEFAPIMLPARMLQGVTTAYVATKRVQSSHPMLLHVQDVKKAREAYRGTRIENLLIAADHKVEFPGWKFDGADYREFIDTTIRSLCAAWQIPWELVMGDHSAKSGASSRSLWQAHYQMAEREQADHVNAVQRPVDESILRELDARNGLGLSPDWWSNMAGVYQGPPRVMPDPQKEITWAEGMRALGVSRSTILNRFGEDFRDEIMQDRQDRELEAAQNPEPEKPDEPEAEDVEPTAPAPALGPDETQEIEPPADELREARLAGHIPHKPKDMTHAEFISAMRSLAAEMRGGGTGPVIHNHTSYDIKTEDVVALGTAIAAATPAAPAPVINMPAPVVHVAAAEQRAPVVHVSAPSVTVQAADPAPVVVNVSPTPVTIENTVEVPQRPIRVVSNPDGSATMTPEA